MVEYGLVKGLHLRRGEDIVVRTKKIGFLTGYYEGKVIYIKELCNRKCQPIGFEILMTTQIGSTLSIHTKDSFILEVRRSKPQVIKGDRLRWIGRKTVYNVITKGDDFAILWCQRIGKYKVVDDYTLYKQFEIAEEGE